MNPAHDLLCSFAPAITPTTTEDRERIAVEARPSRLQIPSLEQLQTILARFPSRDIVQVSIVIDDHDTPSAILRTANDCAVFIERIRESLVYVDENSHYQVSVMVYKRVVSRTVSIYSVDCIVRYLTSLSLLEQLGWFAELLAEGELVCVVYDGTYIPSTSSIAFCGPEEVDSVAFDLEFDRAHLLRERADACHFANAAQFPLLPDDFEFRKPEEIAEDNPYSIGQVFRHLHFALTIASLADFSEVDADGIRYRIHGYRVIEDFVTPAKINDEIKRIYSKIYHWAYGEGNITDKIGLVRNVLSLHWQPDGIPLDEGVLSSIRSSHKIYLRENLESYVEVKNRVVAFLLQQNDRATSVVSSFATSLKSNLTVFVSFVISVVVLNTINAGNLENIFTADISIICMFLIGVSAVFLVVSVAELNQEKVRFERDYLQLKESYSDLLDEIDIDRIFANDEPHRNQLEYIEKKLKRYKCFWAWSLFLFAVVVAGLWWSANKVNGLPEDDHGSFLAGQVFDSEGHLEQPRDRIGMQSG